MVGKHRPLEVVDIDKNEFRIKIDCDQILEFRLSTQFSKTNLQSYENDASTSKTTGLILVHIVEMHFVNNELYNEHNCEF